MVEAVDERFGREVAKERERRGWSMTELASRLSQEGLTNFHAATVGRLERGTRPVRLSEAVVIASVMGKQLDDLLVAEEPLERRLRASRDGVRWAYARVHDAVAEYLMARRVLLELREEAKADLKDEMDPQKRDVLEKAGAIPEGFLSLEMAVWAGRRIDLDREIEAAWDANPRTAPPKADRRGELERIRIERLGEPPVPRPTYDHDH